MNIKQTNDIEFKNTIIEAFKKVIINIKTDDIKISDLSTNNFLKIEYIVSDFIIFSIKLSDEKLFRSYIRYKDYQTTISNDDMNNIHSLIYQKNINIVEYLKNDKLITTINKLKFNNKEEEKFNEILNELKYIINS